jgi:ubiquinone/menaquinone biosynthesis C-methylase UbiE
MEQLPSSPRGIDHQGFSESLEEVITRYLSDLGLTKEDLRNKSVLDVGAGSARFAEGVNASAIGATVVSVEQQKLEMAPESLPVLAHAQKLPFADQAFDYVFSVRAIPQVAAVGKTKERGTVQIVDGEKVRSLTKEDFQMMKQEESELVSQAVRECLRVVKVGGEVRFGSVPKLRKEFVEAVNNAVVGIGEISQRPEANGDGLYILKRV